jgi:transcriptional regulator with XRE-family HTH domain
MVPKEECEAVTKLRAWLTDNNKTQAWLASKCGVSQPSVRDWMIRVSRPLHHLREIIEVLTGDHVLTVDWEFPSEREKRDQAIRQIQAEAEDELSGDAA